MLKTQKAVHEMMKALDLPLPNEVRPGLKGLKYDLLRSLVSEEAAEFENAMSMLQIIAERDDAWHMSVLAEFHKVLGEEGFRQFCEMDKDEFVTLVKLKPTVNLSISKTLSNRIVETNRKIAGRKE